MDVRAHGARAEESIRNIAEHSDTPAEVRKARLKALGEQTNAAIEAVDAETAAAVEAELKA